MTGIALFGAGRIGRIHASNLHRHDQAELLHVVDVDEASATELAAHCNAQVSTVEAALADPRVKAVVIASPTDTHANLLTASARAGKAIFCEKPLDLDIDTARNSVREAAQAGVVLCVGFNRRHDPDFEQLKRQAAGGGIGAVEVVTITSRDPSPPPADYVARSGGLFRDMMIHDFDLARWLLAEDPVRVFASGSVLIDPEIGKAGDVDTAIAVLETESGRLCHITNSRRCSYGYDQRIEVFGSDGMVRAGNARATRVEAANASGFLREPALPFFLERYAAAYRLQLDKFLRVLGGEALDIPGGDDGLKALMIADAAQRSSDTGFPVEL